MRPVLVIVGASGAGKSTLAAALHRLGVIRVHPTWTTRAPRADEPAGSIGHRFVTDAVFDRLDEQGFFVDVARPFGLPHRYGLPPIPCSCSHPTGRVDAVLARASYVCRLAPHVSGVVVYQVEAPSEVVATRLDGRATEPPEIAARRTHDDAERELGCRLARRVLANTGTVADLVAKSIAAIATDFPGTVPIALRRAA